MPKRYSIEHRPYSEAIDDLQRLCLPGDEPVYDDPSYRYWLAFNDKKPVAFIIMHDNGSYWYLKRAGTLPAHEGNRLYPRLLRAAFKAMRKAGVRTCVTDTANWNWRSNNGLIRAGFRTYLPQEKWSWEDGLYWKIDL
jgi:hypothetical protein